MNPSFSVNIVCCGQCPYFTDYGSKEGYYCEYYGYQNKVLKSSFVKRPPLPNDCPVLIHRDTVYELKDKLDNIRREINQKTNYTVNDYTAVFSTGDLARMRDRLVVLHKEEKKAEEILKAYIIAYKLKGGEE